MRKIFNEIFVPIISDVFKTMFTLISEVVMESCAQLLLDFLKLLLDIIHYLIKLFDVFSGSEPITYKVGNSTDKTTLIEYLFELNGIGRAFVLLTIIGGILAFLFAMYQTGKIISDNVLEENKPISKVLANGLKTMLAFMIVPVLCVFMLQLSNAILKQINITFSETQSKIYGVDKELGIDDIIFNSVIIDAVPSSLSKEKQLEIKNKYQKTARAYADREQVEEDLDIAKIDYLMGYLSGVLMLLILIGASIAFIRRCFDLLILYLISPVFSATIVLDGGVRFSKWRDIFVGKFFAAFGAVFAMRLYLMVSPFFSSGMITYTQDKYMNAFMNILINLGGAWTVYKGQSLVTQLLFGQTTAEEMGMGKALAKKAASLTVGGVKGIASGLKKIG